MRWIKTLLMIPCAMAGLAVPAHGVDRPNIVYLISDDQAWTDYGFMGHDVIQTPHLDSLAARSAVFPRGYVPTSLCRPSLMTMYTGLYAHQHGITGNDPSHKLANPKAQSEKYDALREQMISKGDQLPNLMKVLGEQGYLSHQSGKWWEGSYARGGFTHGMTRGFPEPGGRHGDDGLKIGREGMAPVFDFIEMAVEEDKPFFVAYMPFLPHTPHTPPERILKKYQKEGRSEHVARYYAMCEWFDETCGQLIDYVDEKGLTENTLFVYICDNGWIQSEDSKGFAPGSKQSPMEGGVRQPTLYSLPGVIEPAVHEDALVSSIDMLPTTLAAVGASIPSGLPGLNLMPVLKGEGELERVAVFGEGFAHDVADVDDPTKSLLYRWIVEGDWKLILKYDGEFGRYASKHPMDDMRPQLYNLKKDPYEKTNVAADHPEVLKRLADRIGDWYDVGERKTVTSWE